MPTYTATLTNAGLALYTTALASGIPVQLTAMAVGDGNGNPTTPDPAQTILVHEVYRDSLSSMEVDDSDPTLLFAEFIVPPDEGGWTIREVGLFTTDGTLFAVSNFAATVKPVDAEGSTKDLVIKFGLKLSNTSAVTLVIDASIVSATREWVLNTVTPAFLIPGGTTDQVLAKESNADGDFKWVDPTAAVNVIVSTVEETQTLAASQTIVDLAVITTSGVGVYIEGVRLRQDEFTINSATRITLDQSYPAGSKISLVQNDHTGADMFARKDGADFTGSVTVQTPPQFDDDTSAVNSAFVQRALGSVRGDVLVSASTTLDASHIGKLVVLSISADVTITMPSATVKEGANIHLLCISSNGSKATIVRAGTNVLGFGNSTKTSVAMRDGDTLSFSTNGASTWRGIGGSESLFASSSSFGKSLAASGYQKLPSGLIIQWGSDATSGGTVDITFPIPFPNACRRLVVSENSAGAWSPSNFTTYGAALKSSSGATIKSLTWNGSGFVAAGGNFEYVAIGD